MTSSWWMVSTTTRAPVGSTRCRFIWTAKHAWPKTGCCASICCHGVKTSSTASSRSKLLLTITSSSFDHAMKAMPSHWPQRTTLPPHCHPITNSGLLTSYKQPPGICAKPRTSICCRRCQTWPHQAISRMAYCSADLLIPHPGIRNAVFLGSLFPT
jgi:hypothetical protein